MKDASLISETLLQLVNIYNFLALFK